MATIGANQGRTRPLRSETRRAILDAASEVFAAQGLAAASLREIAQTAGLTKGAVYSNFASKDDLILALMEEEVLARLDRATKAFEASGDVRTAVRDLGSSLVQAIRSDAASHRLLFEYVAAAHRDPDLHTALAKRRREGRAVITRAIERIVEERGLELSIPAAELTVAVLALSNGLALEASIDSEAVPDDLFGRLIELMAPPGSLSG